MDKREPNKEEEKKKTDNGNADSNQITKVISEESKKYIKDFESQLSHIRLSSDEKEQLREMYEASDPEKGVEQEKILAFLE